MLSTRFFNPIPGDDNDDVWRFVNGDSSPATPGESCPACTRAQMRGQVEPPSPPQPLAAPPRAATDRREMGALHGGGGEVLSGMSVRKLLGRATGRREEGILNAVIHGFRCGSRCSKHSFPTDRPAAKPTSKDFPGGFDV